MILIWEEIPMIRILFLYSILIFNNAYATDYHGIVHDSLPDTLYESDFSQDLKNILSKLSNNKNVIFLGESDHYFSEKYDYRLKFIRFYLDQGIYNLVDEMGQEDAYWVNEYLNSGNEELLNYLGLYGFRYGKEPRDSKRKFVIASKLYLKELYKLKQKYPKLNYAGFDLDMSPGNFFLRFDRLSTQLNKCSSKLIDLIENSKTDRSIIKTAYSYFKKNEQKIASCLGNMLHIEFSHYLYNFMQSLRFPQMLKEDVMKALAWRERRMFEYADKRHKNSERFIYMGHNGHLMKNGDEFVDLSGNRLWYTIGEYLNRDLKIPNLGIWSIFAKGTHSGHGCPQGGDCYFEAPSETFEANIYKLNSKENLLIKTNSKYFDGSKFLTYENGIDPYKTSFKKETDLIYFIPEISAFP